jgi:DNA replication protein DnaC
LKTERECEDFASSAEVMMVSSCPKCGGSEPECECRTKLSLVVRANEACIPRDFWYTKGSDVSHNVDVFRDVIAAYCRELKRARKRGYGLMLSGDNGVGKTMFLSYILMSAIRKGWTAYYTTLPKLDYDVKRGFNSSEDQRRLEWMLTSDFLAIDELGKERFKDGDSYMRMQTERILKQRFDDSMPTLIATNADIDTLGSMYGTTLTSILVGKYQIVTLEPGDFREKLRSEMEADMKGAKAK